MVWIKVRTKKSRLISRDGHFSLIAVLCFVAKKIINKQDQFKTLQNFTFFPRHDFITAYCRASSCLANSNDETVRLRKTV